MWIDTHCHLDAPEFNGLTDKIVTDAQTAGVSRIVIPAIDKRDFKTVRDLSVLYPDCAYALGIHPLYVAQAEEQDLLLLQDCIEQALDDPRFVAIGEIGLDYFVPELKEEPLKTKQEYFYAEQLKLAKKYGLPVLLHVRRSQDIILKHLRKIQVVGGIAHAFNGSFQQAQTFLDLGFKIGLGGAMTFPRSLQIRRLAAELPLSALVLETDSPDIPPAWLRNAMNTPDQIPKIGQVLADIRQLSVEEIQKATTQNAMAILPRLTLI